MKILIALLLSLAGAAAQAAYPEKPIRFILGSAPGGSVDVLTAHRATAPPGISAASFSRR